MEGWMRGRSGEHEVVIAGCGPTGMMLAAELALAGVDVAIVERRAERGLESSRSGGLHARTIEVLDQRGVADRFLAAGRAMQVGSFADEPMDISDFPTRHNYGLALWQNRFEEILAGWVEELDVTILRGVGVVGLEQDGDGVDVDLSDDSRLRAAYVVGCDGGRSFVRKAAGIEFSGWEAATSYLIAELEASEEPELGLRRDEKGVHAIGPLGDGDLFRAVVREEEVVRGAEPSLDDFRRTLIGVRGTDYGVHSPRWISRFSDVTRQAASYREGRVLLAGDAAHIHSPVGGQGLNLGIQDAVNLGWKLARVVDGTSHPELLDTYEAERHPVGARVLRTTMAMTLLNRSDPRTDALRETLAGIVVLDEPRRHLAAMISGLDVHYDLGEGHPLLGRRMPDLDLTTSEGATRVFSLLNDARPLLLDLRGGDRAETSGEPGGMRVVRAGYAGPWELPVLGEVTAPTGVLVRPDGHVAWVGEGTDEGLDEALEAWFGIPAPA
jgi:2-polyprenyl-6-methoxyphenol hydroxylase-like FAD-dependent oxidoreductase